MSGLKHKSFSCFVFERQPDIILIKEKNMITINNANVKMYSDKGLEGKICYLSFKRDEQSFDTLKELGRANATVGMLIVMQSITYHGVTLYPE